LATIDHIQSFKPVSLTNSTGSSKVISKLSANRNLIATSLVNKAATP